MSFFRKLEKTKEYYLNFERIFTKELNNILNQGIKINILGEKKNLTQI